MRSFLLLLFVLGCTLLHSFDERKFFDLLNRPLPSWMQEQIQEDLEPHRGLLSSRYLQQVFLAGQELYLLRIRVKNGRMWIENEERYRWHGSCPRMADYFRHLHQLICLPDVDLLLSLHDSVSSEYPLPVFTVAKKKKDPLILIPDWDALSDYKEARAQIMKGSEKYPWSLKIEKMFWRGTDTGVADPSNWSQFSRPQLVLLSNRYPQELDAKLTGTHYPGVVEKFQSNQILGAWASYEEHCRYKYVIDVDGNACTWPRYFALLLSNSVCLKQSSENAQWFYKGLHPYEHYIPIEKDFSDLMEKFHWARSHDNKCRKIAENATQFAKEMLSEEAVYLYLYSLVREYAKAQNAQHE